MPRPNSDAHHFFQFGPFFRLPTHGTMDKRINLELRGRQPAEVSWGLVGFLRSGGSGQVGVSLGQVRRASLHITSTCNQFTPPRSWGGMKRDASQVMVWVEGYLGIQKMQTWNTL